jgi:L-rhamnose mutarotase
MRRMGLCNRLRPEKVEEYKALHAAAWPDVLACISAVRSSSRGGMTALCA